MNNSTTPPTPTAPIFYHFETSTAKDPSGNDVTLITTLDYPFSILQVVPIPEGQYDAVIEKLKERGGYIAVPNNRKDFAIIHLSSGDYDGKHPERYIEVTQDNHMEILKALHDSMIQAAAWWAAQTK